MQPAESLASTSPEFERLVPRAPSSFYSAGMWQLGIACARCVPRWLCARLALGIARAYLWARPKRRQVVIHNLLPALGNDLEKATLMSADLFRQFALKLVDLWQYESGQSIQHLFAESSGWEHLQSAQATGRGVLLLTPHLGNWEFGAPLLAERGIKLLVVTLTEPESRLTELRKASRARRGIETVVVGEDPFAFVEIIKRLQNGATVALLVDRPREGREVRVELFGKPFYASMAVAELARASGCVLLPAYIPRTAQGYAANVLAPINYDRATLRDLPARQELTQEIMRAFEPAIRQYLNQWYHFIPIWPA